MNTVKKVDIVIPQQIAIPQLQYLSSASTLWSSRRYGKNPTSSQHYAMSNCSDYDDSSAITTTTHSSMIIETISNNQNNDNNQRLDKFNKAEKLKNQQKSTLNTMQQQQVYESKFLKLRSQNPTLLNPKMDSRQKPTISCLQQSSLKMLTKADKINFNNHHHDLMGSPS
ncbi:hypothetical protein BLA29_009772, partial [Euroglyphus maynei]